MIKNKKYCWILSILSILVGFTFQEKVYGETKINDRPVIIDGHFSDWDPSAMNELSYYKDATHYNLLSFKNDGQNLYVYTETVGNEHTQEFSDYEWRIQSEGAVSNLKFNIAGSLKDSKSGTKLAILPTISSAWGSQEVTMVIPDGTNKPIVGASGYITTEQIAENVYRDRSEVKIPLTGFIKNPQAVKNLNILNYKIGNGSFDIPNNNENTDTSTSSSTNDSTSTSSSDQSTDNSGDQSKGGPIVIDGKFDDWTSYPKETISFSYENGWVTKQGSFVRDGEYLYIYLDMNPNSLPHNYRFQPAGWTIQIGNNTLDLQMRTSEDIWSLQPGGQLSISAWIQGINSPDKLFVTPESKGSQMGNYNIPGSIGYVTTEKVQTKDGQNFRDRAEIKIPLAGFLEHPEAIQSMKIYNHNLGDQTFEVTGGSTGSTIIILSGVVIAGVVVYRYSKKKKELSK